MLWVWLVALGGVLIFVAKSLVLRRLTPRMDRIIRTGGFTVEQVQAVHRMVISHGRLPSQPDQRSLAIVLARQGAQNYPFVWWVESINFLAVGMVSTLVVLTNNAWFLLAPLLLLYLSVQSLFLQRRALKNSRKITRDNMGWSAPTEATNSVAS